MIHFYVSFLSVQSPRQFAPPSVRVLPFPLLYTRRTLMTTVFHADFAGSSPGGAASFSSTDDTGKGADSYKGEKRKRGDFGGKGSFAVQRLAEVGEEGVCNKKDT